MPPGLLCHCRTSCLQTLGCRTRGGTGATGPQYVRMFECGVANLYRGATNKGVNCQPTALTTIKHHATPKFRCGHALRQRRGADLVRSGRRLTTPAADAAPHPRPSSVRAAAAPVARAAAARGGPPVARPRSSTATSSRSVGGGGGAAARRTAGQGLPRGLAPHAEAQQVGGGNLQRGRCSV
jgi:hypothetical protein